MFCQIDLAIGGSKGASWTPPSRSNFFHFHAVFGKNLAKQECIAVGCIPPTCCPYPVVSHVSRGREGVCPIHPGCRPPGHSPPALGCRLLPPLWMQTLSSPWSCDLLCMLGSQPLHVNRQTPVKILPCQWRIQDFPEEGAPNPQGGRQHTILPKIPKNCMKLKEFGPPGGGARPKFYYVDPPLLAPNYVCGR